MLEELRTTLPVLLELLGTTALRADLELAVKLLEATEPAESVGKAGDQDRFRSRWLTYHLCASLRRAGWFDPTLSLLEQDLRRLWGAGIPVERLRAAFRDKLLEDGQFDDTVYEIAAAGVFSQVLDPGSLSLELPIQPRCR